MEDASFQSVGPPSENISVKVQTYFYTWCPRYARLDLGLGNGWASP